MLCPLIDTHLNVLCCSAYDSLKCFNVYDGFFYRIWKFSIFNIDEEEGVFVSFVVA